MTIIEVSAREDGFHNIQSQSERTACWLDGYIEVPDHLDTAVWDTCGWCDLIIEDGVLTGIIPTERPIPPEPEPEPSLEERITSIETAIERGLSM